MKANFATWESLVKRFLERFEVKGHSQSTVRDARLWLNLFVECAREKGIEKPVKLSPRHITAFQRRMLWKPNSKGALYSPNTVAHALGVVRNFTRWATRCGHLLLDPARDLVLPRPVQPPRQRVSTADIDAMVSTLDPNTAMGLRDRTIIELIYQTGVRRGECQRLDLEHVDLESQILQVRQGKGKKDRLLPISESLVDLLSDYLENSRPAFRPPPGEPALFLSNQRRRLGGARVNQIFRQAAQRAGLERGVTPHVLRYAFATHLVQKGAELRHVQEMLGHSQVSTTQFYTRLSALDVAREHRRTHPRARRIGQGVEQAPESSYDRSRS